MEKISHIKLLLYLQVLYFRKIVLIPNKNMDAYTHKRILWRKKNDQLSHRTDSSAKISVLRMLLLNFLSFRDTGFSWQENKHLFSGYQNMFLSAPRMLLLITTFRLLVGVQLLFATVRKFLASFPFGVNGISPTLEHRGEFSAPTYNLAFCFDR